MALQINKAISTSSGFAVASGTYVWLYIELGIEKKYAGQVRLSFYRSKADFDSGKAPFDPAVSDIPDNKKSYSQEFTPQDFALITADTIHQYVKSQLNAVLGGNFVTVVA